MQFAVVHNERCEAQKPLFWKKSHAFPRDGIQDKYFLGVKGEKGYFSFRRFYVCLRHFHLFPPDVASDLVTSGDAYIHDTSAGKKTQHESMERPGQCLESTACCSNKINLLFIYLFSRLAFLNFLFFFHLHIRHHLPPASCLSTHLSHSNILFFKLIHMSRMPVLRPRSFVTVGTKSICLKCSIDHLFLFWFFFVFMKTLKHFCSLLKKEKKNLLLSLSLSSVPAAA